MSSRHQDRPLVEGTEPVTGTGATLPTTRGTSRRAVGKTEEKATSTVPSQRQGKASRTGTSPSTAAAPAASRAKRVTGARAALGGTLASRAKAATAKAATRKAATAKAATAKAATAARTAAVKTVANHTPGVRSAHAAASAARTTGSTSVPAAGKVAAPSAPATRTPAAKPAAAATATKPAATAAPGAKAAGATTVAAKAAPAERSGTKTVAAAKPASAAKSAAVGKSATAAKPATAAKSASAGKPATAAESASAGKAAAAQLVASKAGAQAVQVTPARTAATESGATVRPTPHKRTPADGPALVGLVPLVDAADLGTADTADVVVVRKDLPADLPVASAPGRRRTLFLRRRPPLPRRRPALYLAAAVVAVVGLSAFTPEEPTAQATATVSQPVSVAEQLGIEGARPDTVLDATQRLGELAASRNIRDAEQAAAAHAQAEADRIAAEAAAAAAAEAARPKAVLPVQGARLTSSFGPRWGTLHAGIDLAAPMHTPEHAVMDGVVLEAGPASGFGLVVYIQHENGDVTVYGHMDQILVQPGQVVRAGDTIALLGNRGQSTGPHLHFEVHVGGLDGQKVDPLPWLRDKGVAI